MLRKSTYRLHEFIIFVQKFDFSVQKIKKQADVFS